MSSGQFFESPEESTIIKTKLVTRYFDAWTKIMLPRARNEGRRIAYIDLFSGPGRFSDGSDSTPMWVIRAAIESPELCSRLVTIFNDKNADFAEELRVAIQGLPNYRRLEHEPVVMNDEVGSELADVLRNMRLVPTLFFIDPWGYKGLSLDLIGNAIRSWGCDCIFFFNYNRVNPGLNNPSVSERMADLFGGARAEELRLKVAGMTPEERQVTIINELAEALREVGGKFTLPFEFKSRHGDRTSHYIIFVSKEFLGYHIMKDVMFGLSSDEGDVRDFQFVPVKSPQLRLLFDLSKPHSIPALKDRLVAELVGQSAKVWDIYEKLSVGTPYTLRNFQDALLGLEAEGRLEVSG